MRERRPRRGDVREAGVLLPAVALVPLVRVPGRRHDAPRPAGVAVPAVGRRLRRGGPLRLQLLLRRDGLVALLEAIV